ncbi:RDD family protein [Nakamurella antarctica]|uniref:RDD family protein n=1 Tax=Nakamurella antarctica TaxID=1902245 RepID=A0A3G8ZN79_9ACTN|nr:RDD family protein [Nakamurella antarctica]AZI58255.1 RDD family protein [Nakamurella antarctica]
MSVVADSGGPQWPGISFGAPAEGAGAVASLGQRVGGFLVDIAIAAGVSWLFTAPEAPKNWSLLAWGVVTIVCVGVIGQTPGHFVFGIRVATFGRPGQRFLIGLWAVPRTILVGLVVPALLRDRDGRSLLDKLCHTVVVKTR